MAAQVGLTTKTRRARDKVAGVGPVMLRAFEFGVDSDQEPGEVRVNLEPERNRSREDFGVPRRAVLVLQFHVEGVGKAQPSQESTACSEQKDFGRP